VDSLIVTRSEQFVRPSSALRISVVIAPRIPYSDGYHLTIRTVVAWRPFTIQAQLGFVQSPKGSCCGSELGSVPESFDE
jgi:hypothetical protein